MRRQQEGSCLQARKRGFTGNKNVWTWSRKNLEKVTGWVRPGSPARVCPGRRRLGQPSGHGKKAPRPVFTRFLSWTPTCDNPCGGHSKGHRVMKGSRSMWGNSAQGNVENRCSLAQKRAVSSQSPRQKLATFVPRSRHLPAPRALSCVTCLFLSDLTRICWRAT